PVELEEIPAVLLLERVPEVLAGDIQKRRARVCVNDRSHGGRVRVDPAQMNQLLLNLAQNALLAAEEADRTPILELSVHRQGPWVQLRVADNGAGIPPDEQPKIFDLFYSTRKGGTGRGRRGRGRCGRRWRGRGRCRPCGWSRRGRRSSAARRGGCPRHCPPPGAAPRVPAGGPTARGSACGPPPRRPAGRSAPG